MYPESCILHPACPGEASCEAGYLASHTQHHIKYIDMSEPYDPVRRFNDRAKVYDSEVGTIIPGYTALHEAAHHVLKSSLPENAYLLICGAGTGNDAMTFARENPGWKITGFDIAGEMVKTARAKIKAAGLESRIEIIHGGIEDVLQESFDGAASILVTHFIPYGKKAAYLNDISLRLKPGAKYLTADITGARDSGEFNEHLLAWESFQLSFREDKEEILKTIGRVREDLPILTEDETILMLEDSDFKNVRLFWKYLMINGYVAEKRG